MAAEVIRESTNLWEKMTSRVGAMSLSVRGVENPSEGLIVASENLRPPAKSETG
jgi:hypothetical protein